MNKDKPNESNTSTPNSRPLNSDSDIVIVDNEYQVQGEPSRKRQRLGLNIIVTSDLPAYFTSSHVLRSGTDFEEANLLRSTEILELVLATENLDKEACLNSRLVCRTWNHLILDFIQHHPSHMDLTCSKNIGLRHSQIKDPWQVTLHNNIVTPKKVDHIWDKITRNMTLDGTPLLSRTIIINDRNFLGQTVREWVARTIIPLRAYGLQLWHCDLEFSSSTSLLIRYVAMAEWLKSLPNLKRLQVVYRHRPLSAPGWGWKQLKPTLVSETIPANPMSELKHLTFLRVTNLPYPIFNELVRTIPEDNLLKLQISSDSHTTMEDCTNVRIDKYDWRQWPNLMEASIRLQSKDFEKLEAVEKLWPLKKLHLHLDFGWSFFNSNSSTEQVEWSWWNRIFYFLGKQFGVTLTHLGLILPEGSSGSSQKSQISFLERSLQFRLELPHLQELRIEMSVITTLNFLHPLKDSLTVLFLHFNCIDFSAVGYEAFQDLCHNMKLTEQDSKIFQETVSNSDNNGPARFGVPCSSYIDNYKPFIDDHLPGTSNLWNMLPKLERLTLQFSSCFERDPQDPTSRTYIGGKGATSKTTYVRNNFGVILMKTN